MPRSRNSLWVKLRDIPSSLARRAWKPAREVIWEVRLRPAQLHLLADHDLGLVRPRTAAIQPSAACPADTHRWRPGARRLLQWVMTQRLVGGAPRPFNQFRRQRRARSERLSCPPCS